MKQRENCTHVNNLDSRKQYLVAGGFKTFGAVHACKCSRKRVKGTGFCKRHQTGGGK